MGVERGESGDRGQRESQWTTAAAEPKAAQPFSANKLQLLRTKQQGQELVVGAGLDWWVRVRVEPARVNELIQCLN